MPKDEPTKNRFPQILAFDGAEGDHDLWSCLVQNTGLKEVELDWQLTRADILDALTKSALQGESYESGFSGVCEALNKAGFQIARGHVSTTTLHPVMNAVGVTWRPQTSVSRDGYLHGGMNKAVWRESPFSYMLAKDLDRLHVPLRSPPTGLDFPVFTEFRAAGLTDWIAFRAQFRWTAKHLPLGSLGMIVSWATNAVDGFGESRAVELEGLTPALAAMFKSRMIEDLSRDVLSAYLGTDAAERVLSGAITRGAITDMSAAIMMADIRGFTAMGESLSRAELVAVLNETFDSSAGPIASRNGQILKFMGDGFLAVFMTGQDRAQAARSALQAALEIQDALPAGVQLDIAINVGDVHYGNIGAAERLDFTVIGSAVNETARIESLCSRLGYSVLVSEDAALLINEPSLVPLGRHRLRGVAEEKLIFGART